MSSHVTEIGMGQTRKRRQLARLAFGLVLGLWMWIGRRNGMYVMAAEGKVYFGSESYVWTEGEICPLGVYFDGNLAVSGYWVCLEYDSEALEYLNGADRKEGNLLWVEGGGGESGYKRMLHFQPLAEGDTVVRVVSAGGTGTESAEDGTVTEEEFTVGRLAQAPVAIEGKGSSRLAGLEVRAKEGQAEGEIEGEGEELAGQMGFSPEVLEYHMQVGYEAERLEIAYETEDADASVIVSGTELAVGENIITLTVQGGQEEAVVYMLYVERKERPERTEKTADVKAEGVDGTAVAGGTGMGQTTQGASGDGGTGFLEEGEAEPAAIEGAATGGKKGGDGEGNIVGRQGEGEGFDGLGKGEEEGEELEPELLAAVIAVFAMSVWYGWKQAKGRKRKKKPAEKKKRRKNGVRKTVNLERKAIEVRHVTMEFRLAQDEASSLKEYVIRVLKGQNHYRMLQALCDVSFEVKQGEVVGIIGTNGSGKSTLLKIIAGALPPTEGEVIVDRRKVQILTLGTGFDMELTARENVYLNGAIIGYSREFIDEKFGEIVAFAELEGFMDERMKNFSSGMVSRLGFAIATIRDSADILILDEVLSVGDLFFREKSEARIREMIHSGATVLMVSHSSNVIRKNCDTAVWIEKGALQMAGKPDVVCGAYEQMGKKGETA